jgi:hypothetical protein
MVCSVEPIMIVDCQTTRVSRHMFCCAVGHAKLPCELSTIYICSCTCTQAMAAVSAEARVPPDQLFAELASLASSKVCLQPHDLVCLPCAQQQSGEPPNDSKMVPDRLSGYNTLLVTVAHVSCVTCLPLLVSSYPGCSAPGVPCPARVVKGSTMVARGTQAGSGTAAPPL